jgi:predicted nucleic acid-binding protein
MNGLKYLLDTNILIGLFQRDLIILNLLKDKLIKVNQCAYSAITRMELLSFPSISSTEKEAIKSLLNQMTYLAITSEIEDETINFRYTHKTKLPDSIIAATAKYHQIELVTLDKKLANKLKSND